MSLGELGGALRRTWGILAIGFFLTGALVFGAFYITKPTFEATATFLLLPPASTVESASNPYLQLDGLGQTVDILAVALSDQGTQTALRAISDDVEYSAGADKQSNSPILVISVEDSSPPEAERIRDLLGLQVRERLDSMQRELGVGDRNRVTATLITSDANAEEVGRDQLRMGILVGFAGLTATFAFSALWDARRDRETDGPPGTLHSARNRGDVGV